MSISRFTNRLGPATPAYIDEQFTIVKDDGFVAFNSAEEGGYLVWNGKPEPEAFKSWIVERNIFEASYTLAGVEEETQ
jgi:hypothetical protein